MNSEKTKALDKFSQIFKERAKDASLKLG